MKRIFSISIALLCSFAGLDMSGLCVSINNLPDTIKACKFTQVQLSANLTSPGQLTVLDTLWSPPGGLTDPNILNPVASVGNSNVQYKLTITALGATNLVTNGNFSAGNTGFNSGYV